MVLWYGLGKPNCIIFLFFCNRSFKCSAGGFLLNRGFDVSQLIQWLLKKISFNKKMSTIPPQSFFKKCSMYIKHKHCCCRCQNCWGRKRKNKLLENDLTQRKTIWLLLRDFPLSNAMRIDMLFLAMRRTDS